MLICIAYLMMCHTWLAYATRLLLGHMGNRVYAHGHAVTHADAFAEINWGSGSQTPRWCCRMTQRLLPG